MSSIQKIAATAILLLIASVNTSAQVGEPRNNVAIGINGGLNYSKVSFQPTIKQNNQMGVVGGLTVRYISEKYFAMICGAQLELNYAQRGWEMKFDEGSDGLSYSREMNYLEVPFLAHLAFGKERGGRFFINLGPQMGFLLSNKERSEGIDIALDPERYGKRIENKFDYGIVGGAGVEIRTKAGNFLLEGRYYFGLADFYNSTKKDYFSRSAHTTLTAKISYLFDLKK